VQFTWTRSVNVSVMLCSHYTGTGLLETFCQEEIHLQNPTSNPAHQVFAWALHFFFCLYVGLSVLRGEGEGHLLLKVRPGLRQ